MDEAKPLMTCILILSNIAITIIIFMTDLLETIDQTVHTLCVYIYVWYSVYSTYTA